MVTGNKKPKQSKKPKKVNNLRYAEYYDMQETFDEGYYREIAEFLPERYPIKRVILYASRETLLKRLASRLEGRKSWAAQQIDRCISAFDMDEAQTKIYTEHLKIRQVAEAVASAAGLVLEEDRRGALRRGLDRVMVQCRHIR